MLDCHRYLQELLRVEASHPYQATKASCLGLKASVVLLGLSFVRVVSQPIESSPSTQTVARFPTSVDHPRHLALQSHSRTGSLIQLQYPQI